LFAVDGWPLTVGRRSDALRDVFGTYQEPALF
jgi:hypothetical protein